MSLTTTSSNVFESDPYLEFRPPFARSLPVQILLTGIILTLVSVLFIHLLFTAQYHWPLAPINYALQISGVTTLLISLIATLHVILSTAMSESMKWPYMLNYIAVNVPPADDDEVPEAITHSWNTAQKATWFLMNATTSGLIQITHIHFLTLLFPSRLEARLIIWLLGPLALTAAIVQMLPLAENNDVSFIATSIRNVCNATLTLLFTAALFLWGLVVNRSQAWRTDGGTAAFGAAALSLAMVSTALTFLYVPRQEEYLWLPSLMWAVILWQSFLGWWWWVGAGSGASREEEILQRQEKKEKRRKEAEMKRKSTRERARTVLKGVAGALIARPGASVRQRYVADEPRYDYESDSADDVHGSSFRRNSQEGEDSGLSDSSDTSVATLPSFLPNIVHQWYASLRSAHVAAARRQAEERVERLRELERGERSASRAAAGQGWGLGSFGWRVGSPPSTRQYTPRHAGDSEDEQVSISSSRRMRRRNSAPLERSRPETLEMDEISETRRQETRTSVEEERRRRPSLFWWGPLARWRLQDSTTY